MRMKILVGKARDIINYWVWLILRRWVFRGLDRVCKPHPLVCVIIADWLKPALGLTSWPLELWPPADPPPQG